MTKKEYPLVCFQLKEDAVLGILLCDDYPQSIQKDVKGLQKVMQNYLQKDYKKYNYYPEFEISNPKMSVINVAIRPVYRTDAGSYPSTAVVEVSVPAVYGRVGDNQYECYLPLFEESFYYYDEKQMRSLVKHFVTTYFNDKNPDKIYPYLQFEKPELGFVSLRVNEKRHQTWNWNFKQRYQTLERLAEKLPTPRATRRATAALPEVAWELEDRVKELVERLLATKANILVVGANGVGKSAVIQQTVKQLSNRSRTQKLDHTFWRIMPQRITASAKYLGDWQETVENLVNELSMSNGILWVENIIQMLLSGGEGAEDSVAAFLLPFLQENKLQLLGEATPQELESMRRLLPGFVESFQLLKIEELSEPKVQEVLSKFADFATQKHKVQITQPALLQSFRLLNRYFPYEAFPGKGIKFLGRSLNEAKLNGDKRINQKDITQHFIQQTGLPELFLRDDMTLDSEEIQNHFKSKIIGQDKAIDKLCDVVKVYKAGLNDPNKPIATMLFAGPTGVGKTASAKALANYFFGKGQTRAPLIRIDMSEFQHPSQIVRFIGVGKEVGQLVKDVRERPFSVLLLDEVEKANPAIFDALMTVLDEGILVDHYGRTTNFRNTIIIMTTNLGASNRQSIGFKQTSSEEALYQAAISQHFRPEFVNRIDNIVLFQALNKEDIIAITRIELNQLNQREGIVKRDLKLEFSNKLMAHIAAVGFDATYGARPLQRAVEQVISGPIAKWLLENPELEKMTLRLDYDGSLVIDIK